MCYSIQIDKDIKKLALRFDTFYSQNTLDFFKMEEHNANRIYKNHYAPALIYRKNQRELVPLRFNLLPSFCETNKYEMYDREKDRMKELTTYNAKIENIEKARAYKNLFMRHHCIVPINSFFEWVNQLDPVSGKKKKAELEFSNPEPENLLYAAGVWDHWEKQGESINSFSIITTPPRAEVESAGHHRSPLLLPESAIDKWINPLDMDKKEIYQLMNSPFANELNHRHIK
jgi:putative SOS response-associated peptidase YedK